MEAFNNLCEHILADLQDSRVALVSGGGRALVSIRKPVYMYGEALESGCYINP